MFLENTILFVQGKGSNQNNRRLYRRQRKNPTYEQVSAHKTGHVEAVEAQYDSDKTNYEPLAKLFFETHDLTQRGGQGPDIGPQYKSVIFYKNSNEKEIAEKLIGILTNKGYDVATKVKEVKPFYPAEPYHQNYYFKTGGSHIATVTKNFSMIKNNKKIFAKQHFYF